MFDTDSSHYSTLPACQFLAEKCLKNQQLHFLHIGSCQDGPQLAWGLERTKLSSNSTKKEPCGYDTCYDWEKCSGMLYWCHIQLCTQLSSQLVYLICFDISSYLKWSFLNQKQFYGQKDLKEEGKNKTVDNWKWLLVIFVLYIISYIFLCTCNQYHTWTPVRKHLPWIHALTNCLHSQFWVGLQQNF